MILHNIKNDKFEHINSIVHEGKIVIVATDVKGILWYSVKQDGFEDSYLHADQQHRTGWEKWTEVPLPGRRKNAKDKWEKEKPDQSVIDKQKKELSITRRDAQGTLIIQSLYSTFDQSEVEQRKSCFLLRKMVV